MIKIMVTDVDKLKDNECYDKIYASLSDERKKKADGIKNALKRRQSVSAGWLLRQAEKWFWEEQAEDGISACYTNLSHSGSIAACIVADEAVGVDLEAAGRMREQVVERCFTEEEEKQLSMTKTEKEQEELFTRLWTKKESAAKLTGEGIARIVRRGREKEEEGIYTKTFRIEHKGIVYYMTAAAYSPSLPSEYEWKGI